MLKQQMFEHRTVSLVPFPVRHRVHQPRRISSGETIKTEDLTFLRRAGFGHLLLNHSAHIRTRLKQPINGAFRLVVAYRRRPYMFLCTENPSLLRSFQVEEFCREEKFSHTRQKRSLSFRINEHFNTGCVDFSPPKSCSYVCVMVKLSVLLLTLRANCYIITGI